MSAAIAVATFCPASMLVAKKKAWDSERVECSSELGWMSSTGPVSSRWIQDEPRESAEVNESVEVKVKGVEVRAQGTWSIFQCQGLSATRSLGSSTEVSPLRIAG